jgi:hypothetical protein
MSWKDVKREEWKTLTAVPPQMWGLFDPKTQSYSQNTLGLCDGCRKNNGHYFLQTPDHRAMALCGTCENERTTEVA